MRLAEEITILKRKIDCIDLSVEGSWSRPYSVEVIEAAFWARSVLDLVSNIDFSKYQHKLITTVRTTRSIPDPDHPGSAKAIYEHNKNISLKDLLGAIVHFRYFSFNRHADGNHCLDVQNDRRMRIQIYYSDFIACLMSLVFSERLVVLAICDIAEQDFDRLASDSFRDPDASIFAHINLLWLLRDALRDNHDLKQEIMAEIFGISNIPESTLAKLYFFQSRLGPGNMMVIGFAPDWKKTQDVFSPPFDRSLLFSLVRNAYL